MSSDLQPIPLKQWKKIIKRAKKRFPIGARVFHEAMCRVGYVIDHDVSSYDDPEQNPPIYIVVLFAYHNITRKAWLLPSELSYNVSEDDDNEGVTQ